MRRLKYEMCKNWREKGNCKYGDKCLFAHGTNELTKRSTANGPEPAKPLAEPKAVAPSEDKKSTTETVAEVKTTDKATSQEDKGTTKIELAASRA